MKNKISDYFKLKAAGTFSHLLRADFEATFTDKAPRYSSLLWINDKTQVSFYITIFIVNGACGFSGSIYSKIRPTAIDLHLLLPLYYPECTQEMFAYKEYEETDIFNRIDSFLSQLLQCFGSAPLSEIITGQRWLDGFVYHPHDQVLGIPWKVPEKIKF